MNEELYQEQILDHYRNPHHKKELTSYSFKHRELNPLCGDELTFYIQVKKNKISDIAFMGHGCAISQASASLLAELLYGKLLYTINRLTDHDIYSLLGISITPTRTKCALLSLFTLKQGLENYFKKISK